MDTKDIYLVLERFPAVKDHFIGVFPIDLIPKTMYNRSCLIFNRDKSSGKGSHWLCIVKAFEKNYYIFDSLGTKFNEIHPYLHFKKAVYYYNTKGYQEPTSQTCGFMSLYFMIHCMMNLGTDFHELLSEIFVENKTQNETLVLNFFEKFA